MKIDHITIRDTEAIIEQSKKLIMIGYWDNLKVSVLLRWLDNFKDDKEKYLAASVLSELIYRNRETVTSMGYNIFSIILPQILEELDIYHVDDIEQWMQDINSPKDARNLPFRTSVINNVDSKVTKSGDLIHTFLQRDFFDKNLGIKVDKLKSLPQAIKAIVFFDDMLGSGSQIDTFMTETKLDELGKKIIFIPFAAIRESTIKVQNKYQNLIIRPVEYLDDNHSFFRETNWRINRTDYYTHNDFLKLYMDMCNKNSINNPLGFGGLGLNYVLTNSTPNNNLSFLWFVNEGWNRLFKR
ncbi:TPA: hypothetical protein ACKFMQ_002955 [Enterobacter hormaechei]|uniref:phosphoribosyltransferase-like protein n=1 Tax=Enterobacter hormaechei TaxID=158836 RepID=UPI000643E7A8|nr:hypothetical protein [Enterobacter hormaechei]KLP91583.1 hypothetical protein ABR37_15190 [Enterobacter hormaechei subsp. hoffmannii]